MIRTVGVIELPGCGLTSALLDSDGAKERKRKREYAEEVQSLDNFLIHTITPYGPVIQTLRMARHRRKDLEVLVAVPRAFLWMLFQVSPPWTDPLAASLPRACSNVCLYMDDVRPSNQHRPDKGRLYYA